MDPERALRTAPVGFDEVFETDGIQARENGLAHGEEA
jgi:hypothetical protein